MEENPAGIEVLTDSDCCAGRFPITEPKTWWTPGTSGRTAAE